LRTQLRPGGLPVDNWVKDVIKHFPFSKLNKYHSVNLFFDAMALYFAYKYALGTKTEALGAGVFIFVILLTAGCVLWASKK
jgi:hypothetical protein